MMGEKSWRQSVATLSLLVDTTYGMNFKILGHFLQVIMFTTLSEVNITDSNPSVIFSRYD